MNSDPIYLEEKIQHSLLVVYLYILRLPTQPSEIRQLNEIISKNQIKTIFYAGTQPLQLQVDQILNVSQETPMKEIVQNIHEELIKKKSNVGLMCSEKFAISLKIYLHYMICIELKKFEELRHNLFKPIYSIEQLKQCYDEIKKNYNVTILDQGSVSILNTDVKGSEIILLEQSKSEIKTPQINNNHRIFNGYQKDDLNYLQNRSKMILGKEDQVMSEFYQSDIIIPPFVSLLETSIEAESKAKSIQHIQLNYNQPHLQKEEYKLPKSIQFLHFTSKNGFKCLE